MIDLGIVPNSAGEWPLGTLLDSTHSRRARHALHDLLNQPLANVRDIDARQQLLLALPHMTAELDWTAAGELVAELESYLNSNFVVFPISAFESAIFTLRYSEITTFVERGVSRFAVFMEMCVALRRRLSAIKADSHFQVLLNAFDAVLDTSILDELRFAQAANGNKRMSLCRLDHRVRVELRERLLSLIAAFYMFDAYCSLATAAYQPGMVMPQIVDNKSGQISIDGLRHPLLAKGIANSITPTSERVMFLTGPNMAGKSTLLRSLGIAIAFAHLGLPVPAAAATIPLTDRLVASLGNEDNLLRAESLYLAEVRRVKSVVASVANGEAVVALLDEVFRGTNVKDASDATTLLVAGLSRADRGLFAVSSHLIEVAEAMRNRPHIGFWCMQVVTIDDRHVFSYKLLRGVSDVRLGMALLESEGVVALLQRISTGSAPHPTATVAG